MFSKICYIFAVHNVVIAGAIHLNLVNGILGYLDGGHFVLLHYRLFSLKYIQINIFFLLLPSTTLNILTLFKLVVEIKVNI